MDQADRGFLKNVLVIVAIMVFAAVFLIGATNNYNDSLEGFEGNKVPVPADICYTADTHSPMILSGLFIESDSYYSFEYINKDGDRVTYLYVRLAFSDSWKRKSVLIAESNECPTQ